ncbi:ATP synthase [Paracoccus aminophilus JCM 7686]|uniref:ATP synthase n=2 Tax=Paracoccus aminophilus TaxID=34003 RepID=S5YCQ3_PARAH|nr:ATP synthase [Paracoccus aminophilus JCM 7686]
MWAGEGPRVIRSPVRFDQTFLDAPTVHVSVAMLDMDSGANHRFDLQAERVTASGFDIIFRTWGDTRVARVRVSWLAIGSVAYRDNWDVI